jgi:hypothetical protein
MEIGERDMLRRNRCKSCQELENKYELSGIEDDGHFILIAYDISPSAQTRRKDMS